jgi:hypothetical protein
MRNKLPGLGIGYFTKLICFLAPQLNGYILDQWLGKSINLLTGKKLVSITDKGWVTDKNDANTYEVFCSKIDALAKLIQCSGLETEERLFSKGAIGKSERGAWRKYVMKHS